MMAKDSYSEKAKSYFVNFLTQSMHLGAFFSFFLSKKKLSPAFFSMKIPLIFLLNYLPLW